MVRLLSGIAIALVCFGGCSTPSPGEGTTPSSIKPPSESASAAPRAPAAGSSAASIVAAGIGSATPGSPAPLLRRFDDIALGGANLCFRERDAVRCLGDWPVPFGTNGQRNQDVRTPLTVSGLSGVHAMTVAQHRACAVLDDATVRCWGNTTPTSSGWTGAPEGRLDAVAVAGLRDVIGLALGWSGSCALTKAGRITCWGPPFRPVYAKGKTGDGTRTLALDGVKQIAADKFALCALRNDGTVHCFGEERGASGGAPPGEERLVPVAGLSDATQISVGDSNSCALTRTGAVYCWGANAGGQLGDGTLDARNGPVRVKGVEDAIQVEVGHGYSCALTRGKLVLCWGDNGNCVVGDEHRACVKTTFGSTMGPVELELCPIPQRISLPIEPERISLGSGTGCGSDASGRVACWGRSVSESVGGCRGWAL